MVFPWGHVIYQQSLMSSNFTIGQKSYTSMIRTMVRLLSVFLLITYIVFQILPWFLPTLTLFLFYSSWFFYFVSRFIFLILWVMKEWYTWSIFTSLHHFSRKSVFHEVGSREGRVTDEWIECCWNREGERLCLRERGKERRDRGRKGRERKLEKEKRKDRMEKFEERNAMMTREGDHSSRCVIQLLALLPSFLILLRVLCLPPSHLSIPLYLIRCLLAFLFFLSLRFSLSLSVVLTVSSSCKSYKYFTDS